MKRIIFFLGGILVATVWFISCSKEYSIENVSNINNEALGIITADSVGNCNQAYINGTYYVLDSLKSDNYALVFVNVASIGKYTIKTNIVNGFYFMDTGHFKTTGIQQLELKGYGIPLVPDTTQFLFSFGNSSCNFFVTNIVDTTTAPKSAFFKLQGTPSACSNIQLSGKYKSGVAMDTSNYIYAQVNAISTGAYTINTNIINGINFSYTGVFNQKGIQTIKIPASGIPQKTGVNNFSLIGSTGNCTFSVPVN